MLERAAADRRYVRAGENRPRRLANLHVAAQRTFNTLGKTYAGDNCVTIRAWENAGTNLEPPPTISPNDLASGGRG